ncbi:MAG: PASTA domain-containing protein, partial [Anaeroplasmataceae bacterium]|nr:PASTA domain-containing protein [Anaeroplasmataceae bacterium]
WIVIFVIFLVWLYFLFLSPRIFNSKTIVVPDVINLSQEEAEHKLQDAQIKYQITYIENDKEQALKTIPYAGTNIKANYVIDLYVGMKFPKTYHSYLGQNYEIYQNEINQMCLDYNIELIVEYVPSYQMSGLILEESLKEGSILNEQKTLKLVIALNEETFLMPNLVGMHIEDALELLKDYKISIHVNYYASIIEEDIVLYQSTAPQTMIQKQNRSILELYVSKGITNYSSIDIDEQIKVMKYLNCDFEVKEVFSDSNEHKLVAFKCQKLYDIDVTKYFLWVTK